MDVIRSFVPIHHLHGARGGAVLSLDGHLEAAANHVWRLSILGYRAAGSNISVRKAEVLADDDHA